MSHRAPSKMAGISRITVHEIIVMVGLVCFFNYGTHPKVIYLSGGCS
jgi:hypothetical protein